MHLNQTENTSRGRLKDKLNYEIQDTRYLQYINTQYTYISNVNDNIGEREHVNCRIFERIFTTQLRSLLFS